MVESKMKILCVFTRILGGATFSRMLVNSINWLNVDADYLYYDYSDFAEYKPPFLFSKISDGLSSAWRIRKKYRVYRGGGRALKCDYDIVFFQGYQLMLGFKGAFSNSKIILALDSTPALANRINRKFHQTQHPLLYGKTFLSSIANSMLYTRMFSKVDYFYARTLAVAESLRNDYGVCESMVKVTYMPLDINNRYTKRSFEDRTLTALFVGNDFQRKGGYFILNVFKKLSKENIKLLIVGDYEVSELDVPSNVCLLGKKSQDELIAIYKSCDLFVFPSYSDMLGLVLCEAIAAGLPIISRDIHAQKELVQDGYNGRLLSYDSNVEEWVKCISEVISSSELMASYSSASRKISQELFDLENFNHHLDTLLAGYSRLETV
jgi:glycosyltransferase involved in cell wall biosynthesis